MQQRNNKRFEKRLKEKLRVLSFEILLTKALHNNEKEKGCFGSENGNGIQILRITYICFQGITVVLSKYTFICNHFVISY